MTRKRFTKLVMSAGYDRNHANVIADIVLKHFGNYQKAWDADILTKIRRIIEQVKQAIKKMVDVIMPTIHNIAKIGVD